MPKPIPTPVGDITPLEMVKKTTSNGDDLELLKKPCGDCAVKCGFYKEYSDAFNELPLDEQLARSKKWFCHNVVDRACRGHADNIGVSW